MVYFKPYHTWPVSLSSYPVHSRVICPKTTSLYLYCSSGIMIAAMKYATIPLPVQPKSTKRRRTRVASILKYSPTPPQTPQIIRLLLERYNFFCAIMIPPNFSLFYYQFPACRPRVSPDFKIRR